MKKKTGILSRIKSLFVSKNVRYVVRMIRKGKIVHSDGPFYTKKEAQAVINNRIPYKEVSYRIDEV